MPTKSMTIVSWRNIHWTAYKTPNSLKFLTIALALTSTSYDTDDVEPIIIDSVPNLEWVETSKRRPASPENPALDSIYNNFESCQSTSTVRRLLKVLWFSGQNLLQFLLALFFETNSKNLRLIKYDMWSHVALDIYQTSRGRISFENLHSIP